ncbi:MAG: GNAT family N-acetyltransferase [Solirubrobacteraceae bacterium]|nr:GNAT family N-acetyltransferase [Solirubrobacteraceae bacterium]
MADVSGARSRDLRLRPADLYREGDAVLAVQRAGYAVEARLIGVGSLPPQHETLDDLRREQIWVADDGGDVAGVLGVQVGNELEIARLVVAPEHMRRGIGRALARHAIVLAGDRVIRVGTAAANGPALALYAALGFERVRERIVGNGLPYVDLRRPAGEAATDRALSRRVSQPREAAMSDEARPATARAAVLVRPREIALEERPVPAPDRREVLVEVASVGVCGSDVHWYEHGRIGDLVVRAPLVLGHECSGRVAAVGADVRKHAVGDRVCLEPGVPCGRCRECRAGRYNLCADVAFFATPPVDGAFAEYVTIHEDFAFALPDGMAYDVGALMEPLSVGIWACRKAGITAGDRVLVTGAGPIGLLAMQVARALGAIDVAISDVNEHRLAAAERMGANRVLRAGHETAGEVDALIECSGHPAALAGGIDALRPAGTAVLVGMGPQPTAEIPVSLIQNRELWLTGTFRYANTYPTALELAASGRVDVAALITGHYDLDDTETALRAGAHDDATIKVMVHPGRTV